MSSYPLTSFTLLYNSCSPYLLLYYHSCLSTNINMIMIMIILIGKIHLAEVGYKNPRWGEASLSKCCTNSTPTCQFDRTAFLFHSFIHSSLLLLNSWQKYNQWTIYSLLGITLALTVVPSLFHSLVSRNKIHPKLPLASNYNFYPFLESNH